MLTKTKAIAELVFGIEATETQRDSVTNTANRLGVDVDVCEYHVTLCGPLISVTECYREFYDLPQDFDQWPPEHVFEFREPDGVTETRESYEATKRKFVEEYHAKNTIH